jgi:phage-related holin
MSHMKTTSLIALSFTTAVSFVCSYVYNLTMDNFEQYISLIAVVMLDGFFGVLAGMKREGFQTKKAIKVLRTAVTWIMILTVLLLVERGFKGTAWLSETVIIPFIVFQVISALKNASMIGWIPSTLLNDILDKIDLHKGERDTTTPTDNNTPII